MTTYYQESLLPYSNIDDAFAANAERSRLGIEEVDIGDITFQAAQREPVHRWYRLTPSYSPALVRFFFDHFGARSDDLIVDPFSGRGTTAIEAQRHGFTAIGLELNPILEHVGSYSLAWSKPNLDALEAYLGALRNHVDETADWDLDDVLKTYGVPIPDIHNVFRWWKPGVLKALLVAKALMLRDEYESAHRPLYVALAAASLDDCANIHRNHPTITFDDDHDRVISVFDSVARRVATIKEDLVTVRSDGRCDETARVVRGNACTDLERVLKQAGSLSRRSLVITSPPYPNRFSYVHQTRPQLHFMDAIESRGDATTIDLAAIGGTWGRATSQLQKELIPPPPTLRALLTYYDELAERSVLMCNYATKYFVDIDRHIAQLRTSVTSGSKCAYVVGNSRLSGVEIYTESILAEIFEANGFAVDGAIVFRKRGGRKRLYESAVCATAS